jgi:hypothetical protein
VFPQVAEVGGIGVGAGVGVGMGVGVGVGVGLGVGEGDVVGATGVIAIPAVLIPTMIGVPAALVATSIGVAVPTFRENWWRRRSCRRE